MAARVTSIHRYPVKSCGGASVASAVVEPWGLAGDRRWMLVDETDKVVTAREVNLLLLVGVEPTTDGLLLTAPGLSPQIAVPDPARPVPVVIGSARVTAVGASNGVDDWFSRVAGRAVRLVHLDDPTQRPSPPAFSAPGDRVSLADAFPLLVTTEESLAALNDEVLSASPEPRDPLPMARFRPNLVVSGVEPWSEDDWRRIRVGDVVFRAVKGCDRCVLTTIDPETGLREREPIATLARTRRWDGKTWFGVNLIPDDPGATIRVGDEVEVLEAVAPGSGPVRSAP